MSMAASGGDGDGLRRPVAPLEGKLVDVELHAEPRDLGQLQLEVAELGPLHDDLDRQQQGAEQFGAPGERRAGGEYVRGGNAADAAFQPRAAVDADAGRVGDRPPACEIFSAYTSAAAPEARSKASIASWTASSAMMGTSKRAASRARARRLRRATGCSISATPAASRAAMPRTAVGSFHPAKRRP
jgi:hypothetical protein